MNSPQKRGNKQKSEDELLKEIDQCVSLNQLFTLIQLEGISMQMYAQPAVSDINPKKPVNQEINENNSPFEKLKAEARRAVTGRSLSRGYQKKSKTDLMNAIDDCTSLSQLFALIQLEDIKIQMHSQSGASNLKPKTLSSKEIMDKKDTPLERLKAEVKKSIDRR